MHAGNHQETPSVPPNATEAMRLSVAATLAAVAATACSDQVTAPPGNNIHRGEPAFTVSSPENTEVTLTVDAQDAKSPYVLVGEYPYNTVVNVTASDRVILTWTEAAAPYTGVAGYFTPSGRFDGAGPTGQAQVSLIRSPLNAPSQTVWSPIDNKTTSTAQLMLNGRYVARRSPDGTVSIPSKCGNSNPPGTAPCVTYSGTQTVSVQRLTASLVLSTSHYIAKESTLVTFGGAADPAQIGSPSVQTPLFLESWSYRETAGSTTRPCEVVGGNTCQVRVQSTGVMTLTGWVNGKHEIRTVHCSVSKCPKGNDPIINDGEFRRWAQAALDSSRLDQPVGNRVERAFYVWMRRSDSSFVYASVVTTSSNACELTLPPPPADNDSLELLAIAHTHPRRIGESVQSCKPSEPTLPYNPDANGGGSKADWDYARIFGVDVYAVSPDRIVRLPSNTYYEDVGKNPNKWPRHTGRCPWL